VKAAPRVQWDFYFDDSYIAKIMNLSIEEVESLIMLRQAVQSTIYVELKNPIESAVVLNKERVVFRGVHYRTLGALGMPSAVSLD